MRLFVFWYASFLFEEEMIDSIRLEDQNDSYPNVRAMAPAPTKISVLYFFMVSIFEGYDTNLYFEIN